MTFGQFVIVGCRICDFEIIRQVLIRNGFKDVRDSVGQLVAKYDLGDIPISIVARGRSSREGLEAQLLYALNKPENRSDEYPSISFVPADDENVKRVFGSPGHDLVKNN